MIRLPDISYNNFMIFLEEWAGSRKGSISIDFYPNILWPSNLIGTYIQYKKKNDENYFNQQFLSNYISIDKLKDCDTNTLNELNKLIDEYIQIITNEFEEHFGKLIKYLFDPNLSNQQIKQFINDMLSDNTFNRFSFSPCFGGEKPLNKIKNILKTKFPKDYKDNFLSNVDFSELDDEWE